MSYDKWKRRLAGEKVETFTQPDHEDEGFYRKPIVERHPVTGRTKIVGWIPIAYFIDPFVKGRLCGVVADRDMTDDEVIDLWTWCVKYPISEDLYRAVAERGEQWPDVVVVREKGPNGTEVIADMPIVPSNGVSEDIERAEATREDFSGIGHNNAPPDVEPHIAMAEKIDTAISAAPNLKVIETEEQAALVAGSRNRILELKNEADGVRTKLKAPHLEAGRKIDGDYNPSIKRAETATIGLRQLLLRWEQKKRDDEKAAQEAAQRAADRAIAAGQPEPPPPAVPDTPAPKARVTATYGRAMPVKEKTFVEIDDWDVVIKHYSSAAAVRDLIARLAQSDTDAGIPVPGTHTRTGVI